MNQMQPYRQQPDFARILMIAAAVYAIAPDAIPGPFDDAGVILLALVAIGILSLFQGGGQ